MGEEIAMVVDCLVYYSGLQMNVILYPVVIHKNILETSKNAYHIGDIIFMII